MVSEHTVPTDTALYFIFLLTWCVGWAVKFSWGTAILRPIHEVGWLVHVLSKENCGAISKRRFGKRVDRPGKAVFEGQMVLQDTHQVRAKLLVVSDLGTGRDLQSRGHRRAHGHRNVAGSPATTGVCLGWRSLQRQWSQARPTGTAQKHRFSEWVSCKGLLQRTGCQSETGHKPENKPRMTALESWMLRTQHLFCLHGTHWDAEDFPTAQ